MEKTLNLDYTTASTDDLLAALEQAGRTPERALLEACLARRNDLVPGLLQWLQIGSEQGDDEDPRWYRDIHAGRLLIAFREEKALPLFADIFRDEEQEHLWEWFGVPFSHYGPLAVDMLLDLLKDRTADVWSRIGTTDKLEAIALMHPGERDRIVEGLRTRLPRVDDDGHFVIPPLGDEDQVALWSWVALVLAVLKDTASQPPVKALYRAGLIDLVVMGDVDDYLKVFDEEPPIPKPFDLIKAYYPSPTFFPPPVDLDREPQAVADASPDHDIDEAGASRYPIGYGSQPTFVRDEGKVGRNDPCPCGSGKKYKKCCGKS